MSYRWVTRTWDTHKSWVTHKQLKITQNESESIVLSNWIDFFHFSEIEALLRNSSEFAKAFDFSLRQLSV